MLYVFTENPSVEGNAQGVRVSNLHPDHHEYEDVLKESFIVEFPANHKTPLEIEANVVRNKLVAGGAQVTIVE